MSWTPAQLGGLWGWWDWSDDAYRKTDNKGVMNGWEDRSPNNHDLTLETTALGTADMAATTINYRQAYGSTLGNQGWTATKTTSELDYDYVLVGVVARMPASGTNDFFVSTRDDAGIAWQLWNPNSSTLAVGVAGTGTYPSFSVGTGNAFIMAARYDLRVSGTTPLAPPGEMVKARWNGQLADTVDAHTLVTYSPSNAKFGIGCQPASPIVSPPVNAAFGEVIVAQKATPFTEADVQRLEGYLAWKWGGVETAFSPAGSDLFITSDGDVFIVQD